MIPRDQGTVPAKTQKLYAVTLPDPMLLAQVVFTLHASFANPTRELAGAPYEVTEHGWGEFEIVVEVSSILVQ